MTAKEYLSKAIHINIQLKSKEEQLVSLRAVQTPDTASAPLSDMPRPATRNVHLMEAGICKFLDLAAPIENEIMALLALRQEIKALIKRIPDEKQKLVLELRYINAKSWPEIAETMDCGIQNAYRLHRLALEVIEKYIPILEA